MSRTKVNKVFRDVMPSAVGELRAAYNEAETARDFRVLPANTHFMAGGKSPGYYKVTAERLHAAVPGSTYELSPEGIPRLHPGRGERTGHGHFGLLQGLSIRVRIACVRIARLGFDHDAREHQDPRRRHSGALSTGAELAKAGSGIVVVPPSMVTAADYTKFAQKLSAALGRPVHTFNRRGRGSSSPQPEDYTLDVDIRDLDTIMKHTSSTDVFGHSFGGAVALHAARTLPVERLAVYDPAVSVNHSVTADWTAEYERADRRGRRRPRPGRHEARPGVRRQQLLVADAAVHADARQQADRRTPARAGSSGT